jgi:magnesium transporter
MLDAIVDNYFVILEAAGERILKLEDTVIDNPAPAALQSIYKLKRQMIDLRRAVWPLRDAINGLLRGESQLIHESTTIYLRDVYDHTIHTIDTIESYRDMISGMLEIYLSNNANKLNQIMKVLTIITTIFIPLSFIAGIYGMNFDIMPELHWRWGYFVALGGMLVIALIMLRAFRKRKWL